MNEELQKALGALLNKTNSGTDTAGEFLASELPDVIQQLLMWYMVESIIFAALFVFIAGFVYAKREYFFSAAKESVYDSAEYNLGGFACMFAAFAFLGVSIHHLTVALQIWIAPKVWLIEYAAKIAG